MSRSLIILASSLANAWPVKRSTIIRSLWCGYDNRLKFSSSGRYEDPILPISRSHLNRFSTTKAEDESFYESTVKSALVMGSKMLIEGGAFEPELSACHLLSHVLQLQVSNGFYHMLQILENDKFAREIANREVTNSQMTIYKEFLQRRLKHEPIQYIIEEWDFYDFTLKCRAPVLCPRPETEELVEWVKEHIRQKVKSPSQNFRILDVGCGTGAIGLALARLFPQASVLAIDKSPEAVALSTENAKILNLLDDVLGSTRYQAILSSASSFKLDDDAPGFDFVVSNPPYIPPADMHTLTADVIEYESYDALCGGESSDGLDVVRDIINQLPEWTRRSVLGTGDLFMEVDPTQPIILQKSLGVCVDELSKSKSNVCFVQRRNDFNGKERFVRLKVQQWDK